MNIIMFFDKLMIFPHLKSPGIHRNVSENHQFPKYYIIPHFQKQKYSTQMPATPPISLPPPDLKIVPRDSWSLSSYLKSFCQYA